MKLLRARFSFLGLLGLMLFGLGLFFQNCAPAQQTPLTENSEDDINHKIESPEGSSGTLSVYDFASQSDQDLSLLRALPSNVPLMVLVRNGQLYPGVQLIVNDRSYLASEYLNLLRLFTLEKPTVPLFFSQNSGAAIKEIPNLEPLNEIKVDFGESVDPSIYCEFLNSAKDPLEADLLIQIADATALVYPSGGTPKIFWSLPLRIFSDASCVSR